MANCGIATDILATYKYRLLQPQHSTVTSGTLFSFMPDTEDSLSGAGRKRSQASALELGPRKKPYVTL